MSKLSIVIVLLVSVAAFAQEVKKSPAADALVSAAKEYTDEQKAYKEAFDQANSSLGSKQKDLQKQIQDAQKQLNDQLAQDKKYKPILDKVNALQKQINDAGAAAQTQFNAKTGPIQTTMATDDALIKGLIPVVRKENGLPDTATFDTATQTWKDTAKEKK